MRQNFHNFILYIKKFIKLDVSAEFWLYEYWTESVIFVLPTFPFRGRSMSQLVAHKNAGGEIPSVQGTLDTSSTENLRKHLNYLAYINAPDLFKDKVPTEPKARAKALDRYRDNLKKFLEMTDSQLMGLLALHSKPEDRKNRWKKEPAGPGAARDKIRARMLELKKASLVKPTRIPGHDPHPLS
jgi:hypothetical protein